MKLSPRPEAYGRLCFNICMVMNTITASVHRSMDPIFSRAFVAIRPAADNVKEFELPSSLISVVPN